MAMRKIIRNTPLHRRIGASCAINSEVLDCREFGIVGVCTLMLGGDDESYGSIQEAATAGYNEESL